MLYLVLAPFDDNGSPLADFENAPDLQVITTFGGPESALTDALAGKIAHDHVGEILVVPMEHARLLRVRAGVEILSSGNFVGNLGSD